MEVLHVKSNFCRTTSGDITLATWGGSTADNLESIEEDENDSGAGQGPAEDEEVDDGKFYDIFLTVRFD